MDFEGNFALPEQLTLYQSGLKEILRLRMDSSLGLTMEQLGTR
jgi:hypothetical protein